MKRLSSLVGVVALGLAGLTACGDESETPAVGSASMAASSGAKLATADVPGLGKVVVDGNGRTVYVFDEDTSGKSTCEGDCLAKWPVVPAGEGAPQLEGIDASLVGTVTRSDGSKQLSVGGLPIYLFAQDTRAGEAKGQAVGSVWWVVGADGKKNTPQPAGDDSYGY
ncbi:hypothetical protein [Kribbella sp. CA-247076]|uniref:hypothetical protein n=1 Tax=Kribbella sp. CA-247076 TaxID=3239941 RepID=UPI003D922F77